ncbi:uncharacterized protein [Panulirus ornatus]|uniref:uncharacterized protein n=1 Tax=Panulirus ornatus TaxID=150431 RepID=UPI003A864902
MNIIKLVVTWALVAPLVATDYQQEAPVAASPLCSPTTRWVSVVNTRMIPKVVHQTVTAPVATNVTIVVTKTVVRPSVTTVTVTATHSLQQALQLKTQYLTSTRYVTSAMIYTITHLSTAKSSLFLTEVVLDTAFVTHTRTVARYVTVTDTQTQHFTDTSTSLLTTSSFHTVTQTTIWSEYVTNTQTERYAVRQTLTETSYDQPWVVHTVTLTRNPPSCYWR